MVEVSGSSGGGSTKGGCGGNKSNGGVTAVEVAAMVVGWVTAMVKMKIKFKTNSKFEKIINKNYF